MHVIKDNSISLLEFVFDLNFDEIIFPENPIKIVQNKYTYLTPYKIGQLSVSFQSKLASCSLSLSFLFSFFLFSFIKIYFIFYFFKLHFPYSRLKLFSHHQHFKIKFFFFKRELINMIHIYIKKKKK